MRPACNIRAAVAVVVLAFTQTACLAQTVVDSDFSKGDFAALGWKAKGDWDVFQYPKEAANNPGLVARFAANKPDGSLTKTFAEVKNPEEADALPGLRLGLGRRRPGRRLRLVHAPGCQGQRLCL